MKTVRNKIAAIAISTFFILSMTGSMILIPSVNAHTPAWQIPTQAYIVAEPSPIGVGQTIQVYMWLTEVYGAPGGTTAAVGTNGYTASAALLSNNYRFQGYVLTVTAPDGSKTTTTFPVIYDTTSSQETSFTPTTVGTYIFNFSYPGQVYGANGNGYSGSPMVGDTYLPSAASTTLTVQSSPIPAAISSEPLPSAYWTEPVYGENSNWWIVMSNWLGSGSGPPQGYGGTANAALYHSDTVGPLTSHLMWTLPLEFGGVNGGNMFSAGGSNPNGAVQGASYYEGSAYQPRFSNPIIMDGVLFYTQPASFTGPSSGPTVAVDLRTGKQLWSDPTIPPLSFGYIYNVWDPDQHGVFPPVLVSSNSITGQWQLYDAYTGASLFNVSGVPASTSFVVPIATSPPSVVAFSNTVASTNILGPSGEELRFVISNTGTAVNPQWYLAEWNMSKLWQYDINPYTGGGSLSPSVINATNGLLLPTLPIPAVGENGYLPTGTTQSIPKGSSITVNANIPINSNAFAPGTTTPISQINQGSLTTYDWNVSIPWLNTMPPPPNGVSSVTGQFVPPPAGANPVSILAAKAGDVMLCRNGSLPVGFGATKAGYPALPYTYFAVNLNASKGAIGSILWMQTYNPPAGNLTLLQSAVDFQTRVFILYELETMQFLGYSLSTGQLLWTTPSATAWDYYYDPGQPTPGTVAYGNLYNDGFGGILYCFNDVTGQLLFTYGNGGEGNSTNSGLNTPYGVYPTQIQSIANGVVYTATDEHTIPDPLYKGAVATAINATTGQEIWKLSEYPSEWTSSAAPQWATADGFITCMNGYSDQIYSIGRGPSKTTIAKPSDNGVTTNTPITITGAVMDISAGTTQSQQATDFPNGVPCASDASMTDWMGYVYQQQAMPTDFTGVQVQIAVLDSNGNHYSIGSATTNEYGTYSLEWTPPITGNYTIYATFAGTNGYWPSSADTYVYASAPSATAVPTATPLTGLASNATVTYGIIAIIVVIVIIGAVLAILVTRKHP